MGFRPDCCLGPLRPRRTRPFAALRLGSGALKRYTRRARQRGRVGPTTPRGRRQQHRTARGDRPAARDLTVHRPFPYDRSSDVPIRWTGLSDGYRKGSRMTGTVLHFPKSGLPRRKIRVPTAAELTRKVRRMLRFNRMLLPHPKAKTWHPLRGITSMQMLTTIKQGQPTGEPVLNSVGDWQITLKRVAAGRKVQVTVSVKIDHFIVVDVI
jgi:hypothetical protein